MTNSSKSYAKIVAINNSYWRKLKTNLVFYERRIDQLYAAAIRDIAGLSAANKEKLINSAGVNFKRLVSFNRNMDEIMNSLSAGLNFDLYEASKESWFLANTKNDELVSSIYATTKFTKQQLAQYGQRNLESMAAFQNRKIKGLKLSQKVWRNVKNFRVEMEMGIDLALAEGTSAAELARDLKKFLNEPDKLFRRYRNEKGVLQLSKAAKEYHTAPGVYRSSYMNALRLARTEINNAYRASDHERRMQLDFVVGVEIRLSNNHTLNGRPFFDICDILAGKYPKSFKFTGWHPQCRCIEIQLIKTDDEFFETQTQVLNNQKPAHNSVNRVVQMPDNFTEWYAENKSRFVGKQLPYFLKDNPTLLSKGN